MAQATNSVFGGRLREENTTDILTKIRHHFLGFDIFLCSGINAKCMDDMEMLDLLAMPSVKRDNFWLRWISLCSCSYVFIFIIKSRGLHMLNRAIKFNYQIEFKKQL